MSNQHENAFDFLRLFAALTVIVGHSVTHFNTNFLWHGTHDNLWFNDGVAMFFVLSGMLVYKSCNSVFRKGRPLKQYYINRFLRIVPAVYVYLILTTASLFLLGVLSRNDVGFGFFAWLASNIFMFPVYYPDILKNFGVGVINGSLWTIPVELSFYLVLPLFVFIKNKFNFKYMAILLIGISIAGLMYYNYLDQSVFSENPIWLKVLNETFIPHLIFFTIGIIMGEFWNKIQHSKMLALLSLLLYILIRYEIIFSQSSVYFLWEVLWAIPFGYTIIWFGYKAPKFFYRITSKIGDISYGIYIWHMVIVNYFIHFGISDKLPGNVSISLVLLITIIIGLMSWWFVEKPALKLKPYSSRHVTKIKEANKNRKVNNTA